MATHTHDSQSMATQTNTEPELEIEIEGEENGEGGAAASTNTDPNAASATTNTDPSAAADADPNAATTAPTKVEFTDEERTAMLDSGISMEEMQAFSDADRVKIKNLVRKRRQADRRADRVGKERDEALRILQVQQDELARMRDIIKNGETQYHQTATHAATVGIQAAQSALQKAYEAGDPAAIAKATAELSQAQLFAAQAQSYQPIAGQVEQRVDALRKQIPTVNPEDLQQQPMLDDATMAWQSRNPWFNTNPRLRNYAIEFAVELENSGITATNAPEQYFNTIDQEMRARFPEVFNLRAAGGQQQQVQQQQQTQQRTAPTSPVAGVSQSTPVKQRVKLPAGAKRIAETLGISIEDYAREYIARNTNA